MSNKKHVESRLGSEEEAPTAFIRPFSGDSHRGVRASRPFLPRCLIASLAAESALEIELVDITVVVPPTLDALAHVQRVELLARCLDFGWRVRL